MEPDEIHRELLAALVEVRRLYDTGEDTWREALATVWIKLSQALGIEPELRVPLVAMQLEFRERRRKTKSATRRETRSARTPKQPLRAQIPLVFAAAAVTIFKKREKMSILDAVAAVARASGLERKKIKSFRDEINRENVPEDISRAYKEQLAELESWPTEGILKESLPRLRGFVK